MIIFISIPALHAHSFLARDDLSLCRACGHLNVQLQAELSRVRGRGDGRGERARIRPRAEGNGESEIDTSTSRHLEWMVNE